MASHQIECDNQEPVTRPTTHAHVVPVTRPTTHAHIVLVGLSTGERLSLVQTLQWIDRGETFFTVSPPSGRTARVIAISCAQCGHRIIRSTADAIPDNNLDNLPSCL